MQLWRWRYQKTCSWYISTSTGTAPVVNFTNVVPVMTNQYYSNSNDTVGLSFPYYKSSTPFELHDDSFVLKAMRFNEKEQQNGGESQLGLTSNGAECSNAQSLMSYQHNHMPVPVPVPIPQPQKVTKSTNNLGKLPTSPPIPGILKGRVKYEH